MLPPVAVPSLVLVFFLIDLSLGLAFLVDCLAGRPYMPLSNFLNLNYENNLPNWYSSIQWFCVAALLGIFAHRNFSFSSPRSWLLAVLPLLFLALSLDEVAQIHEKLGKRSDLLLAGGDRKYSLFPRTGIWMLVVGVPFLVLLVALMLSVRSYLQRAPGAGIKIAVGMAIFLTGALGIESLSNFVAPDTLYDALQVFAEELCEMAGSTVVMWGSYELLQRHGFAFALDPVAADPPS